MTKLTPGVSRLAAVLRLFAHDPGRAWSLTEIVDELGISRSTCHALLMSLDQADLVYRDERKRYSLGTLALELGRAAQGYVKSDLVRKELELFAREFGTISVTNYRTKTGIFVKDWIDPQSTGTRRSPVGTEIPIEPPWGAAFFAWEAPRDQRRWLTSLQSIAKDTAMLEYMERGLRKIRERRYVCAIQRSDIDLACRDMRWRSVQYRVDHFYGNVEANDDYSLAFLASPVLDQHGSVAFVVSITGFCAPLKGRDIATIGASLAERCRKLSYYLAQSH